MNVRTRFAPSPTGRLHLGHVLAARVAESLARSSPAGSHVLRFEDIDTTRVRSAHYREIEQDLAWLGIQWDETPLRQSERSAAYAETLEQLCQRKLVYPCFCTRRDIQEEWANMTAAPQGPEGPVYPGICRTLTTAQRQAKIADGIPYAWRLDARLASSIAGRLTFQDLRFGVHDVNPDLLGDVVLARKDIGTAYHLAVVMDDAFQNISHVTRGEDLLPSTHVHRLLQALLGLPEPVYLHHPLVSDEQGRRLAKRHDALSIAALRESGLTPEETLSRVDAEFEISMFKKAAYHS